MQNNVYAQQKENEEDTTEKKDKNIFYQFRYMKINSVDEFLALSQKFNNKSL